LNVELRCVLFVEENIVVELKSCAEILPVHEVQLLTYMKLLSAPKGIIIKFNCNNIFHERQKTFVNEFIES
jgi:GxxExxY protein